MKNFVLTFLGFLLFPILGNTQTCCSAGAPLSSGIGLSTKENKEVFFQIDYNHLNINRLIESNKVLINDPRERTADNILMRADVQLNNKIGVGILAPIVRHRRSTISEEQTSLGLGDIFLVGQTQLFNINESSGSFSLGIKLPSGKVTHTDDRNILISPDMQSGSGTFDLLGVLSLLEARILGTNINGQFNWIYRKNTTNNNFGSTGQNIGRSFQFGDEMILSTHLNYELVIGTWFVVPDLSLEYRHTSPNKEQGLVANNSGGDWLSLGFGIFILPGEKFSQRIYGSVPVYQNLQGLQISTNFEIGLQLSYRINISKNNDSKIILP